MAVYPSISDIKSSVESNVLIKDTFVRSGTFKRIPNGNLTMYVGGFSVVFPLKKSNKNWVFRCWHIDLGDIKGRYEKFSAAIKNSELPYFAEFEYEEVGIIVNGNPYPTTRMRWIEGQNIKSYICKNRYDKQKLDLLAMNFKKMCEDMHKHNLAHGDLQHGNILVSKEGELYLVDYDSMYCPALKDEKDIITGLADYQHPSRTKNKFVNEKIDYFSELIIYLSILITKENPELIEKYEIENSDKLFFSKKDFLKFDQSPIIADLSKNEIEIQMYLEVLKIYLSKKTINELDPFETVKQNIVLKPMYLNNYRINILNSIAKIIKYVLSILINYKQLAVIISKTITFNNIFLVTKHLRKSMENKKIKGIKSYHWFFGLIFEGLSVLFMMFFTYGLLFILSFVSKKYLGYYIPKVSNFNDIWNFIYYNHFLRKSLEIKSILHPYLFVVFFAAITFLSKRIASSFFNTAPKANNKLIISLVNIKKYFLYIGVILLILFILISILQGETMNLSVFDISLMFIFIYVFLDDIKSKA
jgi:serine/threonine protein kinase